MQIVIFKLPKLIKNQIEDCCPDVQLGKMIGEIANKVKAKAIASTVYDEYLTVALAVSNPEKVISSIFHCLNHDPRLIAKTWQVGKRFNFYLTKHEVIDTPSGLGENAIIRVFASAEKVTVPVTSKQRQELKSYTKPQTVSIEVKTNRGAVYHKEGDINWWKSLIQKPIIQTPQSHDSGSLNRATKELKEKLSFSVFGNGGLGLRKIEGVESVDPQTNERIKIKIPDLTPELIQRAKALGHIFLRYFSNTLNVCVVSIHDGRLRAGTSLGLLIEEWNPGNQNLLTFVERGAERVCLWNPFKAQWVRFNFTINGAPDEALQIFKKLLENEILPCFLDQKKTDYPVLNTQYRVTAKDNAVFWENLKLLRNAQPLLEGSGLWDILMLAYANAQYLSQGKPQNG